MKLHKRIRPAAITTLLLTALCTVAHAKTPGPGDMAPAFSSKSLTSQPVSLHQYRGQPVNLIFLDSLCPMPHFPECEQKLEQLNALSAANRDAQWLGIIKGFYVDEAWVKQFVERWRLSFPVIWDSDNTIFSQYRVFGTPYRVSVAADGRIRQRSESMDRQ